MYFKDVSLFLSLHVRPEVVLILYVSVQSVFNPEGQDPLVSHDKYDKGYSYLIIIINY